jgi:TonB-dependent SusC/RagA subfamily outer membrane receptor
MKNLFYILFLFPILIFGQNFFQEKVKEHSGILPPEKVYLHTNQTLYQPGETIYFKGYITDGMQRFSPHSSVLYVDILDPSGSVIQKNTYQIEKGRIEGFYTLPQEAKGGLYHLKAYTNWQKNLKFDQFEKEITVQRIIAPRLLMKLEIEKESYGNGDEVVAKISIRNLQDIPLRNLEFEVTAEIDDQTILSQKVLTDEIGAYQLKFNLPQNLKGDDGSVNVKFEYENNSESISRTIPILLNSIDLQFLPEGGFALPNVSHTIAFKALNKHGKPADVKGDILDESGNKVAQFETFHQGMGSFELNMKSGKKYFAQINSPYVATEKIPLPEPQLRPASLEIKRLNENNIQLIVHSAENQTIEIIGKTISEVIYQKSIALTMGRNEISVSTENLPMGILEFTLFKNRIPLAERLIFNHQDQGLNIQIETDKEIYNTREKVNAKVKTETAKGNPISANLSVAVVNDKLLSYHDDKQHNINTWLLAGSELKGEVFEPKFYFDPTEDKRQKALDLLLLTQGWRLYNWENILSDEPIQVEFPMENLNVIEGRVLKIKSKYKKVPYPTTVYFIHQNILYVEETDVNGYFKFNLPFPIQSTTLYASRRVKEEITIEYPKYDPKVPVEYHRKSNNQYSESKDILDLRDQASTTDTKPDADKSIPSKDEEEVWDDWGFNDGYLELSEVTLVGGILIEPAQKVGAYTIVNGDYSLPFAYDNLSGQVAGIQITGNPGNVNNIVIRGVSSLSGNTNPLIVIDGVPVSSEVGNAMMGNISSSNINSVTVLKDASATALYGARGANGVIVINTFGSSSNSQNFNISIGKNRDFYQDYYYKSWGNRYYNFSSSKEFYIPKYTSLKTANKDDFRTTTYWNYNLTTYENGEAEFYFYNSDESTVFRIIAEGFDGAGLIGRQEKTFSTQDEIEMDVKFPLYATEGDKIQMPIWVKNNSAQTILANLTQDMPRSIQILDYKQDLFLQAGENQTQWVPMLVENGREGKYKFRVNLLTDTFRQSVTKDLEVFGRGFPFQYAKSTIDRTQLNFQAQNIVPGSESAVFTIYLNPLEPILKGVERILSEPHGCFEQVSSSTFPNIYVLKLLEGNTNEENKKLEEKAKRYLERGYKKLAAYEVKGGGFDWYGNPPAHETLSAFGLIQFTELKGYVNVDQKMVERTKNWLISRKDSIGGYKQDKGKYGFKNDRYLIANAYINYALSFAGEKNIEEQYQASLKEVKKSKDLYRLSLMALTAHQLGKSSDYMYLMESLKSEIFGKGFDKISAEGSITYSGRNSLKNEILALYAQALMKNHSLNLELNQVMKELMNNGSNGYFGSTQATGLALKAIQQYTKLYNQSAPKGDKVFLKINGEVVLEKTMTEYLELGKKENKNSYEINVLNYLKKGTNNIHMEVAAPNLSFVDFSYWYRSTLPDNSKESKVQLQTSLSKSEIKVAETTQMKISVQNLSKEEIPMTVTKIGIPGGLSVEPNLLKELLDQNKVAFYELMDNFLVLYWRNFDPNETKNIQLVFKAEVPGQYSGVASSAYLYYTEEHKHWNEGLKVKINP